MYAQHISQYFDEPTHAGTLGVAATHRGHATNAACLDELTLELALDPATGCVTCARFTAQGCVPTVAIAQWLCGYACGRPLAELRQLTAADLMAAFGPLPANKKHAAHLAAEALHAACASPVRGDATSPAR